MKAIILAGGSGTRLWPASTQEQPKQFLNLDGAGPLLVQTMQRCALMGADDDIYVVTRDIYAEQVETLLTFFNPELTTRQIIQEPVARNTAPALLLVAKHLLSQTEITPEDVLLILPSDHLIQDNGRLQPPFMMAEHWAKAGHIVTFGSVPTRPETGFGYIKVADALGDGLTTNVAYKIDAFVEKPDEQTALAYLNAGGYYWNMGIFAFQIQTLLNELEAHAPALHPFVSMDYDQLLEQFENIPPVSFDYAVMEKTSRALVMPVDAPWSDVGSWDSVYEMMPQDDNRNGICGNVVTMETEGSLIMNLASQPMAIVGMKDVIAIQTEEGLLISGRGGSQGVRHMGELIRKSKKQSEQERSLQSG